MVNEIFKKINVYEEDRKLLNEKYKEIEKMCSDNLSYLKEYIEKLTLEESELFMEKYQFFMFENDRKELKSIIESKKNEARYMPILNNLKELGFSNKKIVKLDEFLKSYIEPSYGNKKNMVVSLGANGFYSILTDEDKKILYKFLIKNKVFQPILKYFCNGDHSDDCCFDYSSKEISFKKSDIESIKKLLEYKANDDGNKDDNFYEEYENLEDKIKTYCPICGDEIDLDKVVASYESLLNGKYCESIELI